MSAGYAKTSIANQRERKPVALGISLDLAIFVGPFSAGHLRILFPRKDGRHSMALRRSLYPRLNPISLLRLDVHHFQDDQVLNINQPDRSIIVIDDG